MIIEVKQQLPRNHHFFRLNQQQLAPEVNRSYFVNCDVTADCGPQLLSHKTGSAIPVLGHPGPWLGSDSSALFAFEKALDYCRHAGFSTVVLGADDDGLLHQALSPRTGFEDFSLRLAYLEPFAALYSRFFYQWGAALTVEELCPAGTDATEGIGIAEALQRWGASFIIGSGGTRDFPPLKWRRKPQTKNDPSRFVSAESWLASAQWLVPHLTIPVLASGSTEDIDEALALSRALGLWGIVSQI